MTREKKSSLVRTVAGLVGEWPSMADVADAQSYAEAAACAAALILLQTATWSDPAIREWAMRHANPTWRPVLAEVFSVVDAAESNAPAALAALRREAAALHPDERDRLGLHLVEEVLQTLDRRRRAAHGVFFTPLPIAAAIVAAVDRRLQQDFGLTDGLADRTTWGELAAARPATSIPANVDPGESFVRFLDPAVGSGVFLLAIIDCVHHRISARPADWSRFVGEYLLPRLVGIDLLLPTCAAAFLNLIHKLAETGFDFRRDSRIEIHQANALAGPPERGALLPFAEDESQRTERIAQAAIYDSRFTVVVGNPPFAGMSQQRGAWINDLLKGRAAGTSQIPPHHAWANYFEIDGRPLGERKHWLHDDYVKFLRLAHWQIERTGCGIIGFITNHGYLDNPTFRGLRHQMLRTFPRIELIDLHGNRKKGEQPPDGSADENVFGIDQGTAIGIFSRPCGEASAAVEHAELWGRREDKIRRLGDPLPMTRLHPASPDYRFVPAPIATPSDSISAASAGWRLCDAMPVNVTAPVTARDRFVIAFRRDELIEQLAAFADATIPDSDIRRRYFGNTRSPRHAPGDTRGWNLAEARRRLASEPDWQRHIRPCWYRPLDRREIFWADWMIDWPRTDVMRHLLAADDNLAIITRRQMLPTQPCNFFWITDTLALDGVIRSDNRGSESLFPLYLFDDGGERRPNFAAAFVEQAERATGWTWRPDLRGEPSCGSFGPESLFFYVYALFFAECYRRENAAALRTDFPRVPLPRDAALFARLSNLGRQLADWQLLRVAQRVGEFQCDGPEPEHVLQTVAAGFPRFDNDRVWINRRAFFEPVPERVWDYRVGAHQVAQKWLKDRRGRVLSEDELATYPRILAALDATIRIAAEIETAIAAAGGLTAAFANF